MMTLHPLCLLISDMNGFFRVSLCILRVLGILNHVVLLGSVLLLLIKKTRFWIIKHEKQVETIVVVTAGVGVLLWLVTAVLTGVYSI